MPRRKGLYPKYLTVVVSQKRHDEIKARAAAREESMGSYVRTLLREGMEREFPEKPERAIGEGP